MKLYAIGDIHGCYDELISLLSMIDDDIGSDTAKIVFIGDYVDRGPDSALVVDHLNELRVSEVKNIEYIFLKGNHEDMLIRGELDAISMDQSELFYYNGGAATIKSYLESNYTLEDHRDFYESLVRYHRHDDFFFVHAGLAPSKTLELALEHNFSWLDDDPCLWMREWNNYDGEFPENVFVVHGHTPVKQVEFKKNQINIDTGCVFGRPWSEDYGQLTAVRLDGRTQESIKIFQVKRRN